MKKLYTLAIAAGLTFALTGCTSSTSLSTASTDKDKDGIVDIQDQCPMTITGTKVSKDGCKIYETAIDLNEYKLCNVNANGIETVIATAKKYNTIAVAHKVEFMRFGASTSAYIKGVDEAIKSGSDTANVKQKKKVVKFDTSYAAQRACKFAVAALKLEAQSKLNWKDAVPGDGYKY